MSFSKLQHHSLVLMTTPLLTIRLQPHTTMSKSLIPSVSLLTTLSRALRTTPRARPQTTTSSSISRTCLNAPARRTFTNSPSRSYKTVEEQKSRYKSGVCYICTLKMAVAEVLIESNSHSRGRQDFCSWDLALRWCFTFAMRRPEWRGREWPRLRRVSGDRKLEVRSSWRIMRARNSVMRIWRGNTLLYEWAFPVRDMK